MWPSMQLIVLGDSMRPRRPCEPKRSKAIGNNYSGDFSAGGRRLLNDFIKIVSCVDLAPRSPVTRDPTARATSFTTRCTIRRSRQCRNSARAGTAGPNLETPSRSSRPSSTRLMTTRSASGSCSETSPPSRGKFRSIPAMTCRCSRADETHSKLRPVSSRRQGPADRHPPRETGGGRSVGDGL